MQNGFVGTPKVSICIPTYKQVEFLRKTLESVRKQSFLDYELIISDDSPDDSVKNLLVDFDFGSKLRYYKNEPSFGTPENWNQAIKKARGQYIKILHHDDYFTFDYSLQKFVDLLDNNPKSDFGFSATSIWHLAKKKNYLYKAPKGILKQIRKTPEILFTNNWVGAPSTTIYRSSLTSVYDKKMKWLVDIDFYIQALKQNPNFSYSTEPLITTPKGVAHQVTEDCKDNREVEFFEYFYLYSKIYHKDLNEKPYLDAFAALFLKYNIKTKHELEKLGVSVDPVLFDKIQAVCKSPFTSIYFKFAKIKNLFLQLDI